MSLNRHLSLVFCYAKKAATLADKQDAYICTHRLKTLKYTITEVEQLYTHIKTAVNFRISVPYLYHTSSTGTSAV